eukprot:scaffold14541_cov207-Alexandrium_tamarense.AAC.5
MVVLMLLVVICAATAASSSQQSTRTTYTTTTNTPYYPFDDGEYDDLDIAIDDDVLMELLNDNYRHAHEESVAVKNSDEGSEGDKFGKQGERIDRGKNEHAAATSVRLKKRPEANDITNSKQSAEPQSPPSQERESVSVLIVATVDGTLAGISRSAGHILWKQSRDNIGATSDDTATDSTEKASSTTSSSTISSVARNKFLSPLVSTSTKLTSTTSTPQQWHAVPSIDGTVYLTAPDEESPNSQSLQELSMSTHIRDLVDRAPFVDAHGRFFVGSRRAMVAAVDERTGEILRVIPKWRGKKRREEGEVSDTPEENEGEEVDYDEEGGGEEELVPSLAGRDVVWIGRLEHTVTVHDLHKGTVDIEFSVAEILSVDEMIHGNRRHGASSVVLRDDRSDNMGGGQGVGKEGENSHAVAEENSMERLFTEYIAEALRHPNFGDRLLTLPSPSDSGDEDLEEIFEGAKSDSSVVSGSPFLVSTPNGNVAFRDSISNTFGWISFDMLASPVVYAIEASSGHKIKVNILPDVDSTGTSSSVGEKDSLPEMLERQIATIAQQSLLLSAASLDKTCDGTAGECHALAVNEQAGSVVGSLRDGQLYALPLGIRSSKPQLPLGLPLPHSVASSMAHAQDIHKRNELNTYHAIGFHDNDSVGDDVDYGDTQHIHLDAKNKQSCTPTSPLYPGCLIGASLMMGNILDRNEIASVFEASDLDFDLYLDMLEGNNNRKKNSYFQQFIKVMSSWIAPTVALIFVVSFEMGRRERLKAEKSGGSDNIDSVGNAFSGDELNDANNSNLINQGAIQLTDEILGYGGHGTIVYKGVLDKRQVAVKRLLSMYHTSADREISLLIESDGHPNVVRYFLKEMRGDFVYLALELCDMSLNDLIVSLSKLRTTRKDNFEISGTDDFESATKSILYQIASGVRHIHSLRIVHRDLKPQNILLAQRKKSKIKASTDEQEEETDDETDVDDTTQTTCSDTNVILEMFMNDEYVPKISDMGLGKQLTGQSSFGISTLGTGSVGAGPANGNASIAGAGAGSGKQFVSWLALLSLLQPSPNSLFLFQSYRTVGWQAPEVMAMRFTHETASNDGNESMSEASPLEAAINARTSRSVDIFSLGCIFYCTILPGSHPFGEWYEREANIMKNTPNKEDLEFVSPDASDLILSMIHRDAKCRPTAEEVCEHPFFWRFAKRLKFLCELSDRIELCDTVPDDAENRPPPLNIFAIEKGAVEIFGTSWEKRLDPELMEASVSRRTYDPSSVRDCLRMIRNKHHHYDELPAKLKSRIGSNTDGLSRYISRRFPRLLMHCYHFCVQNMSPDDSLAIDYTLPIAKHLVQKSSSIIEIAKPLITLEPISDALEQEEEDRSVPSSNTSLNDDENGPQSPPVADATQDEPPSLLEEDEINDTPTESDSVQDQPLECAPSDESMSGIVVWCNSNAAKQFNCRGWMRSDDEWEQRLDAKLRKRDANLARCADDPKFRTRLCNHWDVSGGTFCPMRKKGRCIFAHGPVELRVKEGKRKRWGSLVNKHGECANAKASGGEDTYGAARNIENTRKEQGQWNADTPRKQQPKNKGKKTPSNKKEQK